MFPLLQSLDSRVDTLLVKGASSGRRLTLTKLVLSALPAHLLACIKTQKWFYNEIDKRRCGYFWTGQTIASGGQCKIAWDVVCRPIEEGGSILKILKFKTFACSLNSSISCIHQMIVIGLIGFVRLYIEVIRD
jgi:hypothetical protein